MKHDFYIPVMGTGFTIDTPILVAKYNIDSVIPLLDDVLLETMRKFYSEKYKIKYVEIKQNIDARSERITAYLNMVDKIIKQQINEVKEKKHLLTKYFSFFPTHKKYVKEKKNVQAGNAFVNIMTKIDANPYKDKVENSNIYSIALASLRGFAKSTLNSGVVFSAGFNRSLYSYLENFSDFFHSDIGKVKKQIILKVSDYRSALLQSRFLSKKGLFVSEFRVESGLNCGGHTFPTDGQLLGHILEEFKNKIKNLESLLLENVNQAREKKGMKTIENKLKIRITVQGGVGTAKENEFLKNYYNVDAVGWGSPFLFVPEATSVDPNTLQTLLQDKDKIYSSGASPLDVSFQNIPTSTSELDRKEEIKKNNPGSICPKKFLISNTEFTKQPICTASKAYQKKKIQQIETSNFSNIEKQEKIENVLNKACICNDLGNSVLIKYNIEQKHRPDKVSICPGPNLQYFDKIVSLKNMIKHIYGEISLLKKPEDRPHMFIKELQLYVQYLKNNCTKEKDKIKNNMLDSIDYYEELFKKELFKYNETKNNFLNKLLKIKKEIKTLTTMDKG